MSESTFEKLNKLDVSSKVEKKNGLSYLSWAWAWGELCKAYPKAIYKVYENKDELNYFHDGKTAWVKVGVTVDELEHVEMLPVMDFKNKSIPLNSITSFDVNKAIQRALTKAIARHGLGLYIYAGEDLPESADENEKLAPPSKVNTNEMVNAKKEFIKQASDITGINFVKEKDAMEFMLSSLSVPTDGDYKKQYEVIRKWLNSPENFENQLNVFSSQYDEYVANKE